MGEQWLVSTLLSNAEQSTANIFAIYDGWVVNPKIDIFYKVGTVAVVLVALGSIPQTRRLAAWTAAALFVLILFTGKAQPAAASRTTQPAPSSSAPSSPSQPS